MPQPIARLQTPVGPLLVERQTVDGGDEFMVTITGPDIRVELMQRQAQSLAAVLRMMIGEGVDLSEFSADPDLSLLFRSSGEEDAPDDAD